MNKKTQLKEKLQLILETFGDFPKEVYVSIPQKQIDIIIDEIINCLDEFDFDEYPSHGGGERYW
jgi:hypothetical protein